MGITTMILGKSGTGKSASMRNLKPADVLLIQSIRKPLPFKSADWKPATKDGGSMLVMDCAQKIVATIQRAPHKIIVIDDFQYIMANEFMRRSKETGFAKFTDIGRNAWDIINAANDAPADTRVYIMSHTDTDELGNVKAKTIGKMLDEKICLEGMLSIVLGTHVENGAFHFTTKNNGANTVKSPMGLFDSDLIDNDLNAVDAAITTYYGV